MPHVRVTRPDHPPCLLVALGDRHLSAELLAWLVEEQRELAGVGDAQLALARDPDRFRGAGHQVWVLVLLALALPDEVAQHPGRLAATRHVWDHGNHPPEDVTVSLPSARALSEAARRSPRASPRAAARHRPGRRCSPTARADLRCSRPSPTTAEPRTTPRPAAADQSTSPPPTAPTRPSTAAPTPPTPPPSRATDRAPARSA